MRCLYRAYNVKEDRVTLDIFKKLFPKREIIPIECTTLLEQGGAPLFYNASYLEIYHLR